MFRNIIKTAMLFLSLNIITRMFLTDNKEMAFIACIILFLLPFIYTKKNNIITLQNNIIKIFDSLKEKI